MQWYGPHFKRCRQTERLQREAIRWAPTLREMGYENRLQILGPMRVMRINTEIEIERPTTLEEGGKRGGMKMLFNCITGRAKLAKDDFLILNTRRTRGHSKKLKVKEGNKVTKFNFPNRTIEAWNSLHKTKCVPNMCIYLKIRQFKYRRRDHLSLAFLPY